jgi:replicative DNA helicase
MSAQELPDWLPPLTEPPEDLPDYPDTDQWAPTPIRPGLAMPAKIQAEPWPHDPVPLTTDRLKRPFPVAVFPAWVRDAVEAVAEATQTPVDLAASVALACLSTAAGAKVLVQVNRSWVEQVNLYTVTALPPGSRKSPVFRAMTAPLSDAEVALGEVVGGQRIDAELAARIAYAHAEELAKKAEKPGATQETLADATAAAKEAAAIVVPELPRLMTDDVTPESCISLLAKHGGRMAVLSAEGDVFATLTGTRYSAAPNLGVFLKGHAGDKLQVDRKGRESESIDRPTLTLGVTTQPGSLAGLADQPSFRDRGVLARILYSLPHNTVGERDIEPEPVPEHVEAAYTEHLTDLVLTLAEREDPYRLDLDPEAYAILLDFMRWLEPRLHPVTGQLAAVTDWASKLAGAIVRIAALLHVAATYQTGYAQPIAADTMAAAEQVGRYYLDHALAVYDLMGANSHPNRNNARAVLAWITTNGTDTIKRRDLLRAFNGRTGLNTLEELEPAIAVLIEHGYLRQRETKPSRGRPSIAYDVHPATLHTPHDK